MDHCDVVVISEIKKFQRKNGQRVKPNVPRQQQYMRPDQTKVGQQNVRSNQMPRQQQNVRPNQIPWQQHARPNQMPGQQNVRPNQMAGQQNVRPNQMAGRQNVRPIRWRDGGRRAQAGLPWRAIADRSLIRRRRTY